jgi:phosphatidylcholine synthase
MHSTRDQIICWFIHLYTALGSVVALLTLHAGINENYRLAFAWMIVAVLIDATDGPLARRYDIRAVVPQIDGSKLDDISDYANYTLVPIVLLSRADWLPEPKLLWAGIPLVASLFTFAHTRAKEKGFFRGFPSYWNIVVFYVAVLLHRFGSGVVLATILGLSVLSVMPVKFVYPNRAPRFYAFFIWGGLVWLVMLCGLIWQYPYVSNWLVGISLVYPVAYVVLSFYLSAVK